MPERYTYKLDPFESRKKETYSVNDDLPNEVTNRDIPPGVAVARERARFYKDTLIPDIKRDVTSYLNEIGQVGRDKIKEGAFKPVLPRINVPLDTAMQLYDQNKAQVTETIKKAVATGTIEDLDIGSAFHELSQWRRAGNINFVGLRPSTACNLDIEPEGRCTYCTQEVLKGPRAKPDMVSPLLEEATTNEDGTNRPNVIFSISGGEPLFAYKTREDDLAKMINTAAEGHGVVNMNSNVHYLTPKIGADLIGSGLAKMHISLDSSDPEENDKVRKVDSFERTLKGVLMMQEIQNQLDIPYPVLHINTVVTRDNIDTLPELFAFLLELRRPVDDFSSGNTHTSPLRRDLIPHFLFVHDDPNTGMFVEEGYMEKYYDDQLPVMQTLWHEYQNKLNVPTEKRSALFDLLFFADPKTRFGHSTKQVDDSISKGFSAATEGMASSCYALGTQGYMMPDGKIYPCGSFADHRRELPRDAFGNDTIGQPAALGFKNAVDNLIQISRFSPAEEDVCQNCAGGTVAINLKAEKILKDKLIVMLQEELNQTNYPEERKTKILSQQEQRLEKYLLGRRVKPSAKSEESNP